jgi:hypothetical protein
MGQASEYRKRAEECVEIARRAQTPAQRTMLLHIRDTWLRLAADAEENALAGSAKISARRPLRLM